MGKNKPSDIHIPTVEEIAAQEKVYGILFPDKKKLMYMAGEKLYAVRSSETQIELVFPTANEVYFETGRAIHALFSGSSSEKRIPSIYGIREFHGRIIDVGMYGIYDTLDNRPLLSEEELNKQGIHCVYSLELDQSGRLFGEIRYADDRDALVEIREDYSIGDELIDFYQSNVSQIELIPWGNLKGEDGKNYPFSTLSCINSNSIYLNRQSISISLADVGESIQFFRHPKLDGDELEIEYFGLPSEKTWTARIDLSKRMMIGKEESKEDWGDLYYSVQVTSLLLHQRLVEKGKITNPLEND